MVVDVANDDSNSGGGLRRISDPNYRTGCHVSPGGRTHDGATDVALFFHEGITWRNGEPLTCEHARFTLETTVTGEGLATGDMQGKPGFLDRETSSCLDDMTLELNLVEPKATAIPAFTDRAAVMFNKAWFEANGEDAMFTDTTVGTDEFGRDVFRRVAHGARVSLHVGFDSVMLGTGAGAPPSQVPGCFTSTLDSVVHRIIDMWTSMPDLNLAIVATPGERYMEMPIIAVAASLVAGGQGDPSHDHFVFAVGTVHRRVRLACHPQAHRPHFHGPLPYGHVFHIIMPSMFGTAILTGQTAQFLRTAPWMPVSPGLAVSITVPGVAVAGDALRDILDQGRAWQIGQRRRTSLWPCGGA